MTTGDHLDPADAAVWADWSWSTVPAPVLAVEGVERGEPHVPLIVVDGPDQRAQRNLTPAQAREVAAALAVRADVIDPDGAQETPWAAYGALLALGAKVGADGTVRGAAVDVTVMLDELAMLHAQRAEDEADGAPGQVTAGHLAVVAAALRLFSGDLVDIPDAYEWVGGTTARAHAMADHARQYSRTEVHGPALADLLDAIVAAGLTTEEEG